MKLYRYTTHGEGVFSAGKRLLPDDLIEKVGDARSWLPKPQLPQGAYRFYLTEKGRELYTSRLKPLHEMYLDDIQMDIYERDDIDGAVYHDAWQVVFRDA